MDLLSVLVYLRPHNVPVFALARLDP